MMKYILLTSVIFSALLISCGKEGCIDENATNYDPDATKEDPHACTYDASIMVWLSQETADTLSATYPLDIWIGGGSVGTINLEDALSTEPTDCAAQSGTVVYNTTLSDGATATSESVYVWDADNNELGSWFAMTLNANDCLKLKF